MKEQLLKFSILFFLFAGVGYTSISQAPKSLAAEKGWLDLRAVDPSVKDVALKGDWAFFWNRLVTPNQTIDSKVQYISFPSLWTDSHPGFGKQSAEGYCTYGLTIVLHQSGKPLALKLPDTYSSYVLYLNGQVAATNGQPGTDKKSSIPFWSTNVVNIPANVDTVKLLLQVANFWHAKGGTYKQIWIGSQQRLLLEDQRTKASALILTGCLLMGGLFFLGLYLFNSKDQAILFFSLFCLAYSYRLIGTDVYPLHSLFPNLSWFLTIRLEYLSLSVGVGLFGLYTRCLYPDDTNSFVVKLLAVFCLIFSLSIIFSAPIVFTHFITPFLFIMFGYTAYACVVYARAAGNKRSGSVYALLSACVMLLIFLITNLNYFQIIPPLKGIVFASYIAFFFLQSLALSHRFAFTFRKAAAEASEGLRIKSEFLATMSHEIRTPLNSVIGMAHLLRLETPRDDQKENLDILYFSANNLLSIVNNILDYNNIEAGKIRFDHIPFDLEITCRNVIAGLKHRATDKNIDLQFVADEKLNRKVIGDPVRTAQVIHNLVDNAIKFTKTGWIRLSVQVVAIDALASTISIGIEDTGIGISPDKQKIIFERFTQADSSASRSFGGTGLGLTVTKKILELQGVTLCLKSETGKGSVFYFTQEFAMTKDITDTVKNVQVTVNPEPLMGLRILLAEDNALNVLIAQTILEKNGAKIDVAGNGQEAVNMFDSYVHQMILMDLDMPVMDGYEATRQLRKRGETIPVIALTASTPEEVEYRALEAGISDIVLKPFNPENLCRLILKYTQVHAP